QDAELVRRRDDQEPARRRQPDQLADEGAGVLDVLDRLDRRDDLRRAVALGDAAGVHVDPGELGVAWEAVVADDVDADITVEAIADERPEVACTAADVDERPAAVVPLADDLGDEPV